MIQKTLLCSPHLKLAPIQAAGLTVFSIIIDDVSGGILLVLPVN